MSDFRAGLCKLLVDNESFTVDVFDTQHIKHTLSVPFEIWAGSLMGDTAYTYFRNTCHLCAVSVFANKIGENVDSDEICAALTLALHMNGGDNKQLLPNLIFDFERRSPVQPKVLCAEAVEKNMQKYPVINALMLSIAGGGYVSFKLNDEPILQLYNNLLTQLFMTLNE